MLLPRFANLLSKGRIKYGLTGLVTVRVSGVVLGIGLGLGTGLGSVLIFNFLNYISYIDNR